MTTKHDLMRDCLIDLLNNFQLQRRFNSLDPTDDSFIDEEVSKSDIFNLVDQMLDVLFDYGIVDNPATKEDFAVSVTVRKADTPYGDIVPEKNTKKSEVL